MLTQPEVRDPERDFAAPEDKAIAVAVTLTATISQNRSIVMQTYIPRDAEVREYHTLLDKLDKAVSRQEARLQLEEQEAQLELEEKTLQNLKEDIVSVDARSKEAWASRERRGPYKRSTQEEGQRSTALTNVARYEDAITKRKAGIARLRQAIDAGEPPEQDY